MYYDMEYTIVLRISYC